MPHYHQHEYDLTSKELFKNIEQPLLQYLMKKPVQLLKTLDIQFQHIESQRADLVYEALIEGQSTIVHLELQTENNNIQILNSQGQVVYQEKYSEKILNINTQNFASGIYFVIVTHHNGNVSKGKFVKL